MGQKKFGITSARLAASLIIHWIAIERVGTIRLKVNTEQISVSREKKDKKRKKEANYFDFKSTKELCKSNEWVMSRKVRVLDLWDVTTGRSSTRDQYVKIRQVFQLNSL